MKLPEWKSETPETTMQEMSQFACCELADALIEGLRESNGLEGLSLATRRALIAELSN